MLSNTFIRAMVLVVAILSIGFSLSQYSFVTAEAQEFAGYENFAPEASFPGSNVGAIPDATACGPTPGTPRNITFSVTGISSAPTSVAVNMTFGSPTHTWMGDIIATLIAPNGTQHTLFGRTGATTATASGDSSDLQGTYTFTDQAISSPSGGWWQEASTQTPTGIMSVGTFRTTGLGGAGATNPMPPTTMNSAFAGVANPNGTWTLRLTDGCNGDTGAVTSANLILNSSVFDAPEDVTGDGKSDFVIARQAAPGVSRLGVTDENGRYTAERLLNTPSQESLAPQSGIIWFPADSNQTPLNAYQHGTAETDFLATANVIGDNKDELMIWRPGIGGVAGFYALNVSDGTVSYRAFGQAGDDPLMFGDFDGDGRDDIAVYRKVGAVGTFFWAPFSDPNAFTAIQWGNQNDFGFVFDYDGDGKSDVAIQRSVAGAGQFWIRRSSDGQTEVINNFGLGTDVIVPGDYDGDGRDDICVSRTANFGGGTFKYFFPRESDSGNVTFIQWGLSGDVITQGDYDGDGITDVAVYRSGLPNGTFYVMKSTGGSQTFVWGKTNDYPVNNWNVH